MATVIAVLGRKGGITKTTLAANLAAALARGGLRTVLVDADGQGNATQMCGVKRAPGLNDVMMNDSEWADCLLPVGRSFSGETEQLAALWVLPSDDSQRELEAHPAAAGRIVERIAELRGMCDAVVVDTSPGITEVHAGMYVAADWAILPTSMEWAAISSLQHTIGYLEATKRAAGGAAEILAIVPNLFSAGEKIQRENYGYLRGRYGHTMTVLEPMRRLTVWAQASQLKQSIWAYEPADDYSARRMARAAAGEAMGMVSAVLEPLAVRDGR
jgi:chromosome partitioning protein